MIRTDQEYKRARATADEQRQDLEKHEQALVQKGYSPQHVREVMAPMYSFHEQLEQEIVMYERLKKGELGDLTNFRGTGRLLIRLRIYLNLSQRDLAARLDVSETQVSRDERNEYRGVSVERVERILEAMGVTLQVVPKVPAMIVAEAAPTTTASTPAPSVAERKWSMPSISLTRDDYANGDPLEVRLESSADAKVASAA